MPKIKGHGLTWRPAHGDRRTNLDAIRGPSPPAAKKGPVPPQAPAHAGQLSIACAHAPPPTDAPASLPQPSPGNRPKLTPKPSGRPPTQASSCRRRTPAHRAKSVWLSPKELRQSNSDRPINNPRNGIYSPAPRSLGLSRLGRAQLLRPGSKSHVQAHDHLAKETHCKAIGSHRQPPLGTHLLATPSAPCIRPLTTHNNQGNSARQEKRITGETWKLA